MSEQQFVSLPEGHFKSRDVNRVNGCAGCVAVSSMSLCRDLPRCTDGDTGLNVIFVVDTEWAERQKPVAEGDGLGVTNQKAWSGYESSRNAVCQSAPGHDMLPLETTEDEARPYTPAGLHKPVHGGYVDPLIRRSAAVPRMEAHKAEYRARNSDPITSHEAAQSAARKAGHIMDVLLVELQNKDQQVGDGHEPITTRGLTGKELAAITGVPLNSVTPRFAQLQRKGLIHPVGKRDKQIVWRVGNGVSA